MSRYTIQTIAAVLLGVVAAVVIATVPDNPPWIVDGELKNVLATVQGSIALLLAYLAWGRYRMTGRTTERNLGVGLMLFGLTNLLIVAWHLMSRGPYDPGYLWTTHLATLAAILFVFWAGVAPGKIATRRPPPLALGGLVLVGMAALLLATRGVGDSLPGFFPRDDVLTSWFAADKVEPISLVFFIVAAVLLVAAALGFSRKARNDADETLGWVGVASGLGAVAAVATIVYTSTYSLPKEGSPYIFIGDMLRGGVYLLLLIAAIKEIASIRRSLEGTAEELRQLTLLDELTGLRNRRGFAAAAGPVLKLAARGKSTVTVLFVDLDNLEGINESFGQAEGDRALQETARIMTEAVRDSDVAARLGVNEFCILLSPGSKPDVVLERIKELLADQEEGSREPWMLSLGIGSATFDPELDTAIQEMIEKADEALGPLDAESVS